MIRFWQCSPVATPMPSDRPRVRSRAWPSTSSGLVGSSIHHGSNAASAACPLDRLLDVPDLVGVHHQHPLGADLLADDRGSGAGRPPGRGRP